MQSGFVLLYAFPVAMADPAMSIYFKLEYFDEPLEKSITLEKV